jgi:hypothetical protein
MEISGRGENYGLFSTSMTVWTECGSNDITSE